MIILIDEDDAGQSPTKTASSQHRESSADDLESALEGRAAVRNATADPPPPPYSPSTGEDQPLLTSRKHARRARYRFVSAFAVALVIFVSSGICFNIMFHLNHVQKKIPRRWPTPKKPPGNPGFPDSEKIIQCVDLNDWTPNESTSPFAPPRQRGPLQIATANFHLPTAADSLFFVSDGSIMGEVVLVPDSDDLNETHVEILRTSRVDVLPKTNICVLEREGGHIGIGVLTPEHKSHSPNVKVNYAFVLKLPASKSHRRRYRSYDVVAPFMLIGLAELDGAVDFESVTIYSPNSTTLIDGLYADRINITTTDGVIQGSMRASSLLSLSSSDELMFVNINLHGGDPDNPTRLILSNTNGSTQANVQLLPQVACGTRPGHSLPYPVPMPLPPPSQPQIRSKLRNTKALPSTRPITQGVTSSSTPSPNPSVISCPPPSFSIHAFSDSALTLNLLSPHPPPSSPPSPDPDSKPANQTNHFTPLLELFASASFGSAMLTLPATYEGSYDVRGRFAVIVDDGPSDPLGKGRTRREERQEAGGDVEVESGQSCGKESKTRKHGESGGVVGTSSTSRMAGKVWWGDEPGEIAERSRVAVRSTKMAYLHFGE